MRHADPNLVMNLAAESHVDRSIDGSGAFIESNVNGTFNLLHSTHLLGVVVGGVTVGFRFHHISTDEVFVSLGQQDFSRKLIPTTRSPTRPSRQPLIIWYELFITPMWPVVLTNF